jgi:hypothetical protein
MLLELLGVADVSNEFRGEAMVEGNVIAEYRHEVRPPRLLYVKTPAPDREPRLADLLTRGREEASYRRSRTSVELGRLVRDDLATLLSERFATRPAAAPQQ